MGTNLASVSTNKGIPVAVAKCEAFHAPSLTVTLCGFEKNVTGAPFKVSVLLKKDREALLDVFIAGQRGCSND